MAKAGDKRPGCPVMYPAYAMTGGTVDNPQRDARQVEGVAHDSTRRVRVAFGAGGVLILLGVVYFLSRMPAQAAPEQPIFFSHKAMVQAGVTCLYCHTEATRSPAAGMPSVAKCMSCHRTILPESPPIQALARYWERQEPIPWVRVNQLPRFVYFSHQAHVVVGGIACEQCHGDVGHMDAAQPVVQMNMGWCLRCHQQQPDATRLMDCITCHQ